jgi:hypothetical protein
METGNYQVVDGKTECCQCGRFVTPQQVCCSDGNYYNDNEVLVGYDDPICITCHEHTHTSKSYCCEYEE